MQSAKAKTLEISLLRKLADNIILRFYFKETVRPSVNVRALGYAE